MSEDIAATQRAGTGSDARCVADGTPAIRIESGHYRWYVLVVLALIYGCHGFDRSIMSILVEPLRAEFALSDTQLGLVTSLAYAVAFSIACIPVGILVDRVNRRNLLAIIVFIWSGLTAVAGLAQSFVTLLIARMGVGAAEAGGSPTALSFVGDYFTPRERATAAGILLFGAAIGSALAAVIGGYITERHGWRTACFVAGLPGMLLALLAFTTLREPRRGGAVSVTDRAGSVKETVRFVLRQRSLLHLFMTTPLVSAASWSVSSWLGAFMMRSHGMKISEAGWIMAAAGAVAAFGSAAGGMLCDRLSGGNARRQLDLAAAILLVVAPVTAAAMLLASTVWAIALTLFASFAGMAIYPIAYANIVGLVRPRMRGLAMAALQVLSTFLGIGLGPVAVGALSDAIGGGENLRYALAIIAPVAFCWASLHFRLAKAHVLEDLERVNLP